MNISDIFYDTEINQYYVVAQIIDCGMNGDDIKFIVFDGFKTDHNVVVLWKEKSYDILRNKAVVRVGGIY